MREVKTELATRMAYLRSLREREGKDELRQGLAAFKTLTGFTAAKPTTEKEKINEERRLMVALIFSENGLPEEALRLLLDEAPFAIERHIEAVKDMSGMDSFNDYLDMHIEVVNSSDPDLQGTRNEIMTLQRAIVPYISYQFREKYFGQEPDSVRNRLLARRTAEQLNELRLRTDIEQIGAPEKSITKILEAI